MRVLQSFAGCEGESSMVGHGTAYQRGAFIAICLLTGHIAVHFIRHCTIIVVVLLTSVVVVASTFTWQQTNSTDQRDVTLIVGWCVCHGAVAGVLRVGLSAAVYPALIGRSARLDSVLLHANLWDSVGAGIRWLLCTQIWNRNRAQLPPFWT